MFGQMQWHGEDYFKTGVAERPFQEALVLKRCSTASG